MLKSFNSIDPSFSVSHFWKRGPILSLTSWYTHSTPPTHTPFRPPGLIYKRTHECDDHIIPQFHKSCEHMLRMSTSTLSPRAVLWLCRCKYLCRALVSVPAVPSGPWQACQAPFVMLSFSLSKGTVPLKTGASQPLRASRKGIGIGVMSLYPLLQFWLVWLFMAPEIHQGEAS